VLVTVLGNIGPWAQRVYLAGGLAPRYLISQLPADVPPHVGSTDVDLIISVAVRTDDAGCLADTAQQARPDLEAGPIMRAIGFVATRS
jgi:hypothetical protein